MLTYLHALYLYVLTASGLTPSHTRSQMRLPSDDFQTDALESLDIDTICKYDRSDIKINQFCFITWLLIQ